MSRCKMKKLAEIFKSVAMVLALLICASEPVKAQESDALRFFQTNPNRPILRATPLRAAPVRSAVPRNVNRSPARIYNAPTRFLARPTPRLERQFFARPPPSTIAPTEPAKPIVPASIFIHVTGDSISEFLAQGLKDTMVEKPEIGIIKHSNSSSGIVREDYFNWNTTLRSITNDPAAKVDVLVMMIGSNDRQQLRDDAGSHEFRSERWQEIYVKRLDDMMTIAREKRIAMIWVGMPVMQSARLSADMLYLNGLFRERAARNGVSYVDIWDGFLNDQGQYASIGPDVNGTIVRLRTADGVHMTKAGARKLAFFVSKEIENVLSRQRSPAEVAGLPPELSEQIRRTMNAPDQKSLQEAIQGAISLPAETRAVPVIAERPLMGPIFILTQPPQMEGARLLKARVTPPMNEINLMIEQVMSYGRLPIAKIGRADDFRWTPPASASVTTEPTRQVN
jgi:uncharacterized protein